MRELFNFSAFDWTAALLALAATAAFALIGWIVSVFRKDVSIVDSLWSLMFLVSLGAYMYLAGQAGWRAWLVLALAAIWGLRLSVYITLRGMGEPEDRRYQEIRANHQPHFKYKSLYIVFGLQALLAWLISLPMLAAASGSAGPTVFDALGVLLWVTGMVFESVGDAQLAKFKRNPDNRGKVLQSGLWRYTRHPNYFGEFLLQWGFFLIALSAGGGWTIFAPALLTFLLLRVSGVALLEKDMEDRRPEYRRYIKETNAFFPGKPRSDNGFALFIVLALSLSMHGLPSMAEAKGADDEWNFRVYVDGKPVGHHRFRLDRDGEMRRITSLADFEYRLLFLTLYDYRHENVEVWDGECLQRIESTTNDNGERFSVEGEKMADGFVVDSGVETTTLPECVKTFAYWNREFLDAPRLLNSQTGEYVEVALAEPVPDEIEVSGAMRPAQRFSLEAGEFEIDLWYTDDRQWVGLQSRAGEGRKLRYVLQ